MPRRRWWIFGSTVLILASVLALRQRGAAGQPAIAAAETDRTLSPYFVVEGAEPGVDALPLESTRATVHVAGVIADVAVRQTYHNQGSMPISARYVFPASTRAAVYGMKMTIGNRVITARIREREAAREEYEQAKRDGKTASLLEQDRPNVFSMNVANILPGDRIEVELRYTELLVPTEGVYELVYPTVVGPRYVSERVDPGAADNQFAASPYQHQGQAPTYEFAIDVDIAAGMKIQSVESPSHRTTTEWGDGQSTARIALAAGEEKAGGNRDFVLRYRLAGAELTSGLLLEESADENFFLLMVQPPERPPVELIPPREYVFIVDVSGSMAGFPLDTAKHLMRQLLGRLRPTDRFDLLLFAGDSSLYADRSVPATAEHIAAASAFLDGKSGGGTELLAALERAMALPRPDGDVSRTFVVITDGYIAEEPAAFEHVRSHLGDANVFAFGIGTSVNRHLIDGLARAGQGEAFVALDAAGATDAADRLRDYLESPVLTHVRVGFDGFDAYDVEPVALPDVFAHRPVIVFGKWRGARAGKIVLTGVSGRGRFVNQIEVDQATAGNRRSLAQLWARTRIARLSDFVDGEANRDKVVALGLRYNLLTRYTSFIAVHQVVRASGESTDVEQPQPLPAGVSDDAIGMTGGDEPGLLWILAGIAAIALVAQWRRSRRAGLA